MFDNKIIYINLINVYYCFKIHYNLLSIKQIKAKNYTFKIKRNKFFFIHSKNKTIFIELKVEKDFYDVNILSNLSKQQFYFIELLFKTDKII